MTDDGGKDLIRRLLVAAVWIPIQITLALLFATGGLFVVLILAILLGPFVGLFFLVRAIVQGEGRDEAAAPPEDPPAGA